MSKIKDDDSRVVAIKMFQSAMTAVEGIPDHLRHTFLHILAHRHREAADMIEAQANAEQAGGRQ